MRLSKSPLEVMRGSYEGPERKECFLRRWFQRVPYLPVADSQAADLVCLSLSKYVLNETGMDCAIRVAKGDQAYFVGVVDRHRLIRVASISASFCLMRNAVRTSETLKHRLIIKISKLLMPRRGTARLWILNI